MIMIQMVDVDKIHPHPDNPRKQLGDIEELSASIRENGIMQNLTVVPYFDEETKKPPADGNMAGHYRTIIGHRRCAAAKKAGVKQVPCVITEMDYPAQVQTMLLENMQRSDLTPFEQAEGFQMMMDLGSSVSDIVKNTGFSESTVRHRLKLMELDQELLQEKSQQNINMFDLIKLEQITDPELKNYVLAKIGTKDFDYAVNEAVKEEKFQSYLNDVEDDVSIFAEKIDNSDYETMRYHTSYDKWKVGKEVFVPDDDSRKYYYVRTKAVLTVYMEKTAEEMKDREMSPEEIAEQEALNERFGELNNIVDTMYETRLQYIKNVGKSVLKENIDSIMLEAVKKLADPTTVGTHLNEILGIEMPKGMNQWSSEYKELRLQQVDEKSKTIGGLNALAIAIYSIHEEYCGAPFYNDCIYQHSKAQRLKKMYDFLECIGYEISTEEQQIMDGTHELYQVKE